MSKLKSLKTLALGLAATIMGWSSTAFAQTTTCSVTGTSPVGVGTYDPFANPTTAASYTTTMRVTRLNGQGGGDTRVVNLYLTGPVGANGITVVPISVTPVSTGNISASGLNQDIFYGTNENPPAVLPASLPANGFLKINFTGNNPQSDVADVTFKVTLPANLDLTASNNLSFTGNYGCLVQGGGGNGTEISSSFANALTFQINVLSALQASFVGTALDFGDITNVDSLTAPGRNTGSSNYVRVQSSGAYTVSLTSANGYRLKHPTGSLTTAAERVNYQLSFLGTTRNESSTGAITASCARAGIGTSNEDRLMLQAVLREGGVGKTPSLGGPYQDTLTVTVTPQNIGTTFNTDCNAFTVP